MTIPRISDYPMPLENSFPANRVTWRVDPGRAVLLMHDVQMYFLNFYDQDGALLRELVGNLVKLRAWARACAVPVVYTAQPHEQTPQQRALLNDMWGPGLTDAPPALQQIVPQLAPSPGDTVLCKWRYSAFQRSDLLEQMHSWNRDQLVIGGVYASIGCMVTAVDAFMNDIQPFLVGDAVADFSEDLHRQALSYVAGRCGSVIDTHSLAGHRHGDTLDRAWLESRVLRFIDDETEIDGEENLVFYGLDSLQVMKLAGELKGRGIEVGFNELAQAPTLNAWWRLIEKRQPAAEQRR